MFACGPSGYARLERHAPSRKTCRPGRTALSRVAHEINNPLGGIATAFEVLKKSIPPDDQYYKFVGEIDKEIGRISKIIRQMYPKRYRPETEKPQTFGVDVRLRESMATLEPIATQRNVASLARTVHRFRSSCPSRPCGKSCSTSSATPSRPPTPAQEVEIDVKQEAIDAVPSVVIAISDRGAGIDAAIRDEIFEPFVTTKARPPVPALGWIRASPRVCRWRWAARSSLMHGAGVERSFASRCRRFLPSGKKWTMMRIIIQGKNSARRRRSDFCRRAGGTAAH